MSTSGGGLSGRLTVVPRNDQALNIGGTLAGTNGLPVVFIQNRSNNAQSTPTLHVAATNANAGSPNGVLQVSRGGSRGYLARFTKDFVHVTSIDHAGSITTEGDVTLDGRLIVAGGSPGAGKVLTSDANGLASWQEPAAPNDASMLSLFFGQDYSVLFPDVIDNTVDVEFEDIFTGQILVVSGPAFEIQRVPGFLGNRPADRPGPSLEFPLIFEYKGPAEADFRPGLNRTPLIPP